VKTKNSFGHLAALLAIGGLHALLLAGCARDTEPLKTDAPPRDPDRALLKSYQVQIEFSEATGAYDFQHSADITASDRVLYGQWEGLTARAMLQFDPDSLGADSLAGGTVSDAKLTFRCVAGSGDLNDNIVSTLAVTEAWEQDSLSWPGPSTDPGSRTDTSVENCEIPEEGGFNYPIREVAVSSTMIEEWLQDPSTNDGLSVTMAAPTAMLEMASSENNFLLADTLAQPPGPRLQFRVLHPDSTEPITVFLADEDLLADTYILSPDAATSPCADPNDCLEVGRAVTWRSIFREELPDLPTGSNVHRAAVVLSVLDHPRFDAELPLEVFRLLSDWPDTATAVADSLIELDPGLVWAQTTVSPGDAEVEILITDLVQVWYDGVLPNQGILIRAGLEDAGVTTVSFAGPNHPTVSLRPRFEIDYTLPYGGRP